MRNRRAGVVLLMAGFGLHSAFAAESVSVATLAQSLDMVWLLIAAMLVFFMQAGFAMVEIGLTRAKNAGNIIMKNLMYFSVG